MSARVGVDQGLSQSRANALASFSVVPLYLLIRKPTLILDFSLTLAFVHICVTTYHAGRPPTSLFFWLVMACGALMSIILAEQVSHAPWQLLMSLSLLTRFLSLWQLCVRREMRDGLTGIAQDEESLFNAEQYELDER